MYNIITCLVSSVILTGGCFKTSGDDGFNILLKFSIILQKIKIIVSFFKVFEKCHSYIFIDNWVYLHGILCHLNTCFVSYKWPRI